MVMHVFDINSNLSQEILTIDTWRAVICSLGHGHKHMLTILPTIWRPDLNPGLYISCEDHKHRLENMFFKLYSHGLVSMW